MQRSTRRLASGVARLGATGACTSAKRRAHARHGWARALLPARAASTLPGADAAPALAGPRLRRRVAIPSLGLDREARARPYARAIPLRDRRARPRRRRCAPVAASTGPGSRASTVPVGGIGPAEAQRATSPYEIFDCRLVLALDDFARMLRAHGVVEVIHISVLAPAAGEAWPASEARHAPHGALAIDAACFVKSDGTTLDVERDFHGRIGAQTCGPAPARRPRRPRPSSSGDRVRRGGRAPLQRGADARLQLAAPQSLPPRGDRRVKWFLVDRARSARPRRCIARAAHVEQRRRGRFPSRPGVPARALRPPDRPLRPVLHRDVGALLATTGCARCSSST